MRVVDSITAVTIIALSKMRRMTEDFYMSPTGRGYKNIPHKHHKHRRGRPK